MDMSLWEDDCTFSDPFSYFGGENSLKRFKTNADNFSQFIRNPISKVTSAEILTNVPVPYNTYKTLRNNENKLVNVVKIGWSFSSSLSFPWRPILAAAGETSHYISTETGKIILYEERWKSKKGEVIKRLFIPGK